MVSSRVGSNLHSRIPSSDAFNALLYSSTVGQNTRTGASARNGSASDTRIGVNDSVAGSYCCTYFDPADLPNHVLVKGSSVIVVRSVIDLLLAPDPASFIIPRVPTDTRLLPVLDPGIIILRGSTTALIGSVIYHGRIPSVFAIDRADGALIGPPLLKIVFTSVIIFILGTPVNGSITSVVVPTSSFTYFSRPCSPGSIF